ncbi:hypothetical protein MTR64_00160 [Novosphingobium sp. 2580]|uniref:PepSY domain-containing protein n=2 Tax=Novosphingobium album (ex Hu et al. 2023) TaxID=2930093 RepID=A0ABT0AW59_9SPHN|nr:hypothetical protein [Novosphingobium album (ex Hu et al. 2023)]
MILAAAVLSGMPARADDLEYSTLDLHGFERAYVSGGLAVSGYDRVREAVPVGSDVANAVAILRHAGAHCQSPKPQRNSINCFYSELLSIDDYVNTYSTWDIHLDLDGGKVSTVSVERTTRQHS